MMMENKKAWLRIIEAVMAILIVASVLIIIMLVTPPQVDIGERIYERQRVILRQISLNDSLRGEILSGQTTNTEKFIKNLAPVSWNFTTRVCEIEEICGMPQGFDTKKEIYADQILITANLTYYGPKKLKLFIWVEE